MLSTVRQLLTHRQPLLKPYNPKTYHLNSILDFPIGNKPFLKFINYPKSKYLITAHDVTNIKSVARVQLRSTLYPERPLLLEVIRRLTDFERLIKSYK